MLAGASRRVCAMVNMAVLPIGRSPARWGEKIGLPRARSRDTACASAQTAARRDAQIA
jgi:hypothetical protein